MQVMRCYIWRFFAAWRVCSSSATGKSGQDGPKLIPCITSCRMFIERSVCHVSKQNSFINAAMVGNKSKVRVPH